MTHLGLLTLLVIVCSPNQAANEVYYITTNSFDLCTVQPCLTLSQFANSSHYLRSNTTLVFLPGTHYLSSINLALSNVDKHSFVMKSENSTAQIKCTSGSHIHFSNVQCIHITNLEFIGCGSNQVKHVEEFVVKDTKFEGQENSGTALELIETTAQILNSTFVSNRRGLYKECFSYSLYAGCTVGGFVGGAIIATNSTVSISQSRFKDNRADTGGAIYASQHSIINMSGNEFINNDAIFGGGVLFSNNSNITVEALNEFHNSITSGVIGCGSSSIIIQASKFHDNGAVYAGGVLDSFFCTITIVASEFYNNKAMIGGGVLNSYYDNIIMIVASEFYGNRAGEYDKYDEYDEYDRYGGVLNSYSSNIVIEASKFYGNSAPHGGVLAMHVLTIDDSSSIAIKTSEFHNNSATLEGGVLVSSRTMITIDGSNFTNNWSPVGAVIQATESSNIQYDDISIVNNFAEKYAVVYLFDSEMMKYDSGNIIFSNNLGSLVAFNSNITFSDYTVFANNQPGPSQSTSGDFQEGGAITLFQSNIFFNGESNFEYNHAENGGAIHSTESKLYVNGNVTIAHNTAAGNGGGVYLSTSELNCQQNSTLLLFNNSAVHKGGGIHAISSSIKATAELGCHIYGCINQYSYIGTRITFIDNAANWGGGLSLEANAKLYILKYICSLDINVAIIFTANKAIYGGAVYVDDDTNSGTCASDTKTECFFQVLAIYNPNSCNYAENGIELETLTINFSQNYANISGSTLHGGLLDRCAVSQFAELYVKYPHDNVTEIQANGIAYFKNVSIITKNLSISSDPVRVCLCTKDVHDCIHQTQHIKLPPVKKGETFNVSLVAVDQVGQPMQSYIQTSLRFTESGLAEGQLARQISAKCTNLTFSVVSPHDSENLTLYASDGPCKDSDLSRATVEIHFLPCSCPIGLQVSGMNNTNCTCECHGDISQYMEQCDGHTGSLVKQPHSRAWISYINEIDLTGYLVYPNCPFDYCLSTSPPLNLRQPDAQCAFNRSSLLCGSCQPGLSLSLGSSHCLSCPSYWPALPIAITIAAILAGIALVTLLLVLNMTVAVGTLNGLIFYANVVYANKSILLPFQETNFVTVFISWLNLEIGIDTCYFPGMDTFAKTWIQLAFPAYVILLVVLVIIISSYSTKFSNLIGKRNPVATLATLILLSYAKLLEICFKSLSLGILEYPDGSSEMIWLPDATVNYLSGKHIPLFITAVLILLVGLVYTALLFSWQWLLCLPKWRIFNWSRNPKIQTFIETYHTPYTPKHRYWTGLLLIARVVLYLITAANISNDPTIALSAINFTVCCLVLLKGFIVSQLYRKWSMDLLETFICLNILFSTIFTWFSLGDKYFHQEAIAYTSVTITIVVLLLIILCHVYTYTSLFSKVKKTMLGRMINRLFTVTQPKPALRLRRYSPPPDDDIHRFDELLDELDGPVNTDDYNTIPLLRPEPVEPTFSIVELPKPRDLAAPADPEEDLVTQHIPGAEVVQVEMKEVIN